MYVDYQTTGSIIGYNTVRASTSAAGSWAGLQAGGGLGSLIGGPLAVIGGIIGGVGGAFGGSAIGEFAVDKMYGINKIWYERKF